MSTISDKYADIFEDIIDHISKEEEKDYATHKLNELTSLFLDMIEKATKLNGERIDDLEESQKKLKKKFDKMYETLQLIKKEIYEDEDYDFEIVCPYCSHEFVASLEDELKEEIECPECHNIIELDWDGEEEENNEPSGCTGHCHTCGLHQLEADEDGEFDEFDEDDDFDNDNDINDNNDDM